MKPSLPQGTRDFGPDVVRKRQYILNTIRNVFELYGFQPLETPAMENLETLMGKYGDEGDKLIFKILNNGLDNPGKEQQTREEFEKIIGGKSTKAISERALKYDLTIPFARYVAMNHGQLNFPFKRYQIQPVWRADRPQKGRYREFYQCDSDVVGSNALLNEVEFCCIYHEVFTQLGIKNYELKINSRKILSALAELCGGAERMMDITIAIDKLDKIGIEKVKEELSQRGINNDQIKIIENYLNIAGSNEEKLASIKGLFANSETGKKGIEEIEYILGRTVNAEGVMLNAERETQNAELSSVNRQRSTTNDQLPTTNPQLLTTNHQLPTPNHQLPTTNYKPPTTNFTIDFTLARGLNYYTGIIFEAKAPQEVKMGSIGGGGRYDDLTGLFGVPNIPGVGISFGVDRIYDVMEEMNLFPETVEQGTKVLFFNLGEDENKTAYKLLQQLRSKGIASEIFHEATKMEKQFKYAEKKNISFVVIIGSRELENKSCVLKNIKTGEQKTLSFDELLHESFTP